MEAIFRTKIVQDMKHNGEKVKIIEKQRDQYYIEFADGTKLWAYASELDFGQ